jgi:signal transduction histidine kinase
MRRTRKPILILVFAAVMLLLLPLLAWLQYQWLGKVSEGERQQMQANLFRLAEQLRDDFDRQISAVYSSFQPRPPLPGITREDYVDAYFRWVSVASHPRLITEVLSAHVSDGQPRLERLNPATRRFDSVEWPVSLSDLKAGLRAVRAGPAELPGAFLKYLAPPIDADIPALFIPVLQAPPEDPQPSYVVLMLSLECIQQEILPALSRSLSPEYSLRVVSRKDPDRIIFESSPPMTANLTGDVRTDLFALRLPDVFGIKVPPLASAVVPREIRSEKIFSVRVFRGFSVGAAAADMPFGDDSGAWQLVITHRSGSVDAAVAQARGRNLAISFGILLILAFSVAMIVVSTGRAQRLARQQMEFVSAVSHELRTPLAVICSAGENLADGLVTGPEHAQIYGTLVRDEGRRLSGMIEQVLDFAGIQSGRKIYNLRPTDIDEVVAHALGACNAQIAQLGFVIDLQIGKNLPKIQADKTALVRAVQNLIGNALKYSGQSRWIGIRGFADAHVLSIVVEDHGLGVPEDELGHIFEPFYRGRDATDSQISGSGLGLSLVKHIVEAHGGTVEVTSTVGRGSLFRINLPADV